MTDLTLERLAELRRNDEIKALRADVRTCEEQVYQTVYILEKRDIITTVGC